jgi:hypothetical protein
MSRVIENGRGAACLYVDVFGTIASLTCAIHCVLMPVVATSLPLLGLGFLAREGAEVALSIFSAMLATLGLVLGFRRHRSHRALVFLPAAIALFGLGQVAERSGWERACVPCLVGGGLLLATAHILNQRLCRACTVCRDIPSPDGSTRSLPRLRGSRTRSGQETAEPGVLA